MADKKKVTFAAREPAYRVFANELKHTKFSRKDESDERAPQYVILPTGAAANRIHFCGILTEKKKYDNSMGNETLKYKVYVNDGTGNFTLYFSTYQQNSLQQISKINNVPCIVSVIGKPSVYNTPDGKAFVSIRVEDIRVVSADERNVWVIDTIKQTYGRIVKMELNECDDPVVKEARELYKANMSSYKQMIIDVTNDLALRTSA